MNPTPAPIGIASPGDGDELARADLYGVLAQLWLAAPDEALRTAMASAATQAPQPGGLLEASWEQLVGAVRSVDADAAAAEYEALFLGVGKPEVFLYGSYYLSGFLHEKPLALLRTDLAALGLTRDGDRGETEDHVAYVLEVMRYLIAGDEVEVCNLEQQRRFFRAHLQPWLEALCDAVESHPRAVVWAALARLTRAFVQVEAQAFDLLEA